MPAAGASLMELYYAPHTCALASHITLEEAGATYTLRRVDLGGNEQRTAAYLAINPKGRVPTLICDQGMLTETPAILAFIAQSFPAAHLAPFEDPFAFATVQSFNS
jgi:glutathione S-transferase